jgi:hypothetical protein
MCMASAPHWRAGWKDGLRTYQKSTAQRKADGNAHGAAATDFGRTALEVDGTIKKMGMSTVRSSCIAFKTL